MTALDLLGDLNAITTSRSAKVCPRSTVSFKILIPHHARLQQLNDPHDSHFSSESDVLESEESEDEDNDESLSTGFEEWHGFQDTAFDETSPNVVLRPILRSNSSPLPVQSSPGMAKITLQ